MIDQALWGQVKARQGAIQGSRSRAADPATGTGAAPVPVHRPDAVRGLRWRRGDLEPGAHRVRQRPQQGHLHNKTTMRRDDLETAVLEGLQHRLMDPDLMAVFCDEYARQLNLLTQEHNARAKAPGRS